MTFLYTQADKLTTFLLTLILLFSSSFTAQAHDDEFPLSVAVTVSGMTCEACVETLEKKFSKEEAATKVNADLETQTINVQFKSNTYISRLQIKEAVDWAGFDLENIEYQYPEH